MNLAANIFLIFVIIMQLCLFSCSSPKPRGIIEGDGVIVGDCSIPTETTFRDPINEYYCLIWVKIKEQAIPDNLIRERNGLGTVIVAVIGNDGKLLRIFFEKRSSDSSYDQMAWKAITNAAPFPPFPKELREEKIEIAFRF